MNPRSPKLLDDISHAAESSMSFTEGLQFSDYERNMLVKSAVERQFEIMGEALRRLQRADPNLANEIGQEGKIIGCRERVLTGLPEEVDDAEVWRIIQMSLPVLHSEVSALLDTVEEP